MLKTIKLKLPKIIFAVLLVIIAILFMARYMGSDEEMVKSNGQVEVLDVTKQRSELPFLSNTIEAFFEEIQIDTPVLVIGEEDSVGLVVARAMVIGSSEEELDILMNTVPNRERFATTTTTTSKDNDQESFPENPDLQAFREEMANLTPEERLIKREELGMGMGKSPAEGGEPTEMRARLITATRYVGEVIDMDVNSITIKQKSGESILIIYTDRTIISKTSS